MNPEFLDLVLYFVTLSLLSTASPKSGKFIINAVKLISSSIPIQEKLIFDQFQSNLISFKTLKSVSWLDTKKRQPDL